MTRKGMAYGRMRQIDKMSPEEFNALPEAERLLWRRTPMPVAQQGAIMKQIWDRVMKRPA